MRTKVIPTNKLSPLSLGFLKSIGWKVIDAWRTQGENDVEVSCPDRWSIYITDKRYQPNENEDFYMVNYWSKL